MLKTYTLVGVWMLTALSLSAQLTLDRQVWATAGDGSAVNTFFLTQTLGEPVAQALSAGNLTLNLGFQQSDLVFPTAIADARVQAVSLFPNPSAGITTLKLSLSAGQSVQVELLDWQGRSLQQMFEGDLSPGEHHIPMETGHLAPGVYLLRLQNSNHEPLAMLKLSCL